MTYSTVVPAIFFVSTVIFPCTQVAAGVLTGTPVITGPGVPTEVVDATSDAQNNDDYTGPGPMNLNQITFGGISITGFSPIDLSISVGNSTGTTEYFLNLGSAQNLTGVPWSGFRIELGVGVGENFQRSTPLIAGVSGLDFDFPTPSPVLSSTVFPTIAHGASLIVFSGGTVAAGAAATGQNFSFDIPNITGGPSSYIFTIRLQPVPAPEPSALASILIGLTLSCMLHRQRSTQ